MKLQNILRRFIRQKGETMKEKAIDRNESRAAVRLPKAVKEAERVKKIKENFMKIIETLGRKEVRAMLPLFEVGAEARRIDQKLDHMIRQWAWHHKETFFKITNNTNELRKLQRSLKTI
jgi:hypothetical protein